MLVVLKDADPVLALIQAEKMVAEQQRREQEAEEIKAYRRTLQFKVKLNFTTPSPVPS